MKGTNPSKEEIKYWNDLVNLVGCVACNFGLRKFNDHCSIHHIDGRTKLDAHKKGIPLCGPHHQDDGAAIAVHPYKKRFEVTYGNQYVLKERADQVLRDNGCNVPVMTQNVPDMTQDCI